jgi:maltose O-acetyltransferase
LEQLLGKVGKRVSVRPSFYCDYGYNIELGDHVFINFNCVFLDCAPIIVGNNVLFAPAVQLYTATHPLDVKTRTADLESAHPIRIEDNVWVGGGAVVLPGVTVGANSVIAAGSVVTKDIPANVVVAGNPAKVIRDL